MTERLKRILIIEDDDVIRLSLRDILESEGYSVFTASDGRQGIEMLKKSPEPCLILLDLMMPVMNGIEFLGSCQSRNIVAAIPVVVMSVNPSSRELKDFHAVRDCVKKPFDLDGLLRLVEKYCEPNARVA